MAVIHADLTAGDGETVMDVTKAKLLAENSDTSFIGTQKTGAFDISGEIARQWLKQPNPNDSPNSMVVKPWANGMDITRRSSDTWIIDFGVSMTKENACLFESPFNHLVEFVKNSRGDKREPVASRWWLHTRPRPEFRKAIEPLNRYIATPRVSKHRFFIWLDISFIPDSRLTLIARSDDTTFGLLNSRMHELWSLATCSWHGVGNDPTYNAKSCFETFPFPAGLTPADTMPKTPEHEKNVGWAEQREAHQIPTPATPADHNGLPSSMGFVSLSPSYEKLPVAARVSDATAQHHADAIAAAAFKLNQLRENWLNPPDWVDWVITPEEAKAGFPKRPQAKPGHEADLKKRTLTNLYNAKPAWLVNAHQALDKTVALAYGWDDYTPDMPDAEILQRLLQLNLARAEQT